MSMTIGDGLSLEGLVASRCVAYNDTASITVNTTPTVTKSNHNTNTDPNYIEADGVITFLVDTLFFSTTSCLAYCTSGTPVYYIDAETSIDNGTTWVRGTNSLRCEQLAASYLRTREYSFAGKFAKGTQLRFVEWASTTGVTLITHTHSGSIAPARRLTYVKIPAVVL